MSIPYNFAAEYKLKEVLSPSDIPEGESYLIQVYDEAVFHIPGDERSRTNPGHGYPASTEKVLTVRQFVTTEQDRWTDVMEYLYIIEPGRKDVCGIRSVKAAVSTRTVIDIRIVEPNR